MVEKIIELSNILESNHYTGDSCDTAREELKSIIIPKVERINELLKKADLKVKWFKIEGFNGNVTIRRDTDWNGDGLDTKSAVLELYDNIFEDYSYTYIDLDYFDKSDEELFEIFKEQSIGMKKLLLKHQLDNKEKIDKLINELNKQIEDIKNLKL
jgi:hypothetical protein